MRASSLRSTNPWLHFGPWKNEGIAEPPVPCAIPLDLRQAFAIMQPARPTTRKPRGRLTGDRGLENNQ